MSNSKLIKGDTSSGTAIYGIFCYWTLDALSAENWMSHAWK